MRRLPRINTIATNMPSVKMNQPVWCPHFWAYQDSVAWIYKHTITEISVAMLIVSNFLTNIVEATFDPEKNKYPDAFAAMEHLFNFCFTVELVINMYAFWFRKFWQSGWNVFDFVVVSIGLITTFNIDLGPLSLLRMMRAFRVFRLFKRIKSLRKIAEGLVSAIPGVVNAFAILLLVMCIYAIIGVEVFGGHGLGGKMVNSQGTEVALQTTRGQDYGYEYFGNFPKALYTVFQVLTGDSWCEAIARATLNTESVISSLGVAFYYVSFVLLCGTILINVVVAVLLGEMVGNEDKDPPAEEARRVMPSASQGTLPDTRSSATSCVTVDATTIAPDSDDDGSLLDDGDDDDDDTGSLARQVAELKGEMSDLSEQLARLAGLMMQSKLLPDTSSESSRVLS